MSPGCRFFDERIAELNEEAEADKPAPPALTPSEVALAKVLAAWVEWPGASVFADDYKPDVDLVLLDVGQALERRRLVVEGGLSERATDLLDRARKAGVL